MLGKPHRESGWSDELIEQANQKRSEPDEAATYESIGASAELDSLIFDGSTYGTPTMAGTDEEQDFLGLPGLLDAEQVKTLLRKRQSEQLDAREAEEKARRAEEAAAAKEREARPPAAPASTTSGSGVASEDIPALRQELNTRVSIMAARTGRPHGAIHTEVRKACGGPPTALCSADQLRERIKYLQQW